MLKRRQGSLKSIRVKDQPGSLVTEMDHASEEMIVRAIHREFPDHAVVAEEGGAHGDSPHCWFIDPLDGTTNYAHGFPVYAVTIGYECKGRLEVGVTYAPSIGELYWARTGGGAFRNGRRIRASRISKLKNSLLCTGFAYHMPSRKANLAYFDKFLEKAQAIRRLGSAALDLAWTACGYFDGYWEFSLGSWDMAGGIVLVREAGGRVTDLAGGPIDPRKGSVLAGNAAIHRQMLAVLRRVRV